MIMEAKKATISHLQAGDSGPGGVMGLRTWGADDVSLRLEPRGQEMDVPAQAE